jgi:hypothetical protein
VPACATVGTTSIADIANAANITSIFIVALLQSAARDPLGSEASRRNLVVSVEGAEIAGRSTSALAESAIDTAQRRMPFVGR